MRERPGRRLQPHTQKWGSGQARDLTMVTRLPSPSSDAWRQHLLAAGAEDVLNPIVARVAEEQGAPSLAQLGIPQTCKY